MWSLVLNALVPFFWWEGQVTERTDAVEGTIRRLGELLGCPEEIESHFRKEFHKFLHKGVLPRKVSLKRIIGNFEGLHLVQDATVCDPQFSGRTAQELLLEDLEQIVLNQHSNEIYLCCVNRGVLAEALPIAVNGNYRDNTIDFLNQVSFAVSPHPDSICAWPLGEYSDIAIWPMDIESLVDPAIYDGTGTPGEHILNYVVNTDNWKDHSSCPSRKYCPFYSNQKLLANKNVRGSLLELLQSYEFVSGKRWNFRELFGLVSTIMVGPEADYAGMTPCEWVDEQVQTCLASGDKNLAYRAAFRLVSKLYMHTLFPRWPKLGGVRNKFTRMLKPSGSTFEGSREIVQGFLSSLFLKMPDNSTTISTMLYGPFGEALDPIGYNGERYVDKGKTLSVNDVEELFSHSISLGLNSINQYLVGPEILLFNFLRQGELFLEQSESSSKQNVSIIKEIHSTMKIFSIRLFKRSIGVRFGIYQNCDELSLYRQTLHNTKEMIKLKRVFEKLINRDSLFQASLITTFGQPEPSSARNALLKCPSIPVKSQPALNREGVPVRSIHYLKVGSNFIPLTFGLYFALYHSNDGLSPSSLPEEIFALLDSTKSYALGEIVRNSETIDQYSIILGNLKEVIKYDDLGGFYVE